MRASVGIAHTELRVSVSRLGRQAGTARSNPRNGIRFMQLNRHARRRTHSAAMYAAGGGDAP